MQRIESDHSALDQLRSLFEPISASSTGRKQVGAIVTAGIVIEHLCQTLRRERMTSIARTLDLPPSSCFNILKTLVHEGILDFDARSKTYGISYGLVAMAKAYMSPGGSLRVIEPLLGDLARRWRVTLVIWRRSGKNMVVVSYFDHGSAVRVHIEPGSRFPLLGGAMGRVIAAYGGLTPRELLQHFSRVKWEKSMDFDQFVSDIEDTREKGWALDDGLFSSGISTISVPIGNDAPVDAVLSATALLNQIDPTARGQLAAELTSLARLIAGMRVGSQF